MESADKYFCTSKRFVEEGDTAIVYVTHGVLHALRVTRGHVLQMKFGALRHEFLIGRPYGSRVSATKGYVYVLRPTPELWTQSLDHRTQILYPPDIALITHLLELRPGSVVGEAGTGSAALSHALLRTIAPHGHLHTFDIDHGRSVAAKKDLEGHGFQKMVTLSVRNVCVEGWGVEDQMDAIFLDLPQPYDVVQYAKSALKQGGGRFCSFSPCIEQVQKTCEVLRSCGFTDLLTVECVPRYYKVVSRDMEVLQEKRKGGAGVEVSAGEVCSGGVEGGRKRRREEEPSEEKGVEGACSRHVSTCIPFPPQQPTHTGYITAATLPPKLD